MLVEMGWAACSCAAPLAQPAALSPATEPRRHTGTAAETVVHVRVTVTDPKTGHKQVRQGSGLVVRCDGFVVVPTALAAPEMALVSGERVRVPVSNKETLLTFASADGPPPPPQRVPHPPFFKEPIGYALAKVKGFHLPCLRLLHPSNIQAGMGVRVVYARPKANDPQQAEAVVVEAKVAQVDEKAPRATFAEPAPAVPIGAVVVAESGLALGIVTQTSEEGRPVSGFTTFAQLHHISNAVALLPDPAAATGPPVALATQPTESDGDMASAGPSSAEAPRPDTAAASADMVWIPGGPVALQGRALQGHRIFYGGGVVCTPGFWVDRREVTAEEYRQFLIAAEYPRLPLRWTKEDLSVPWRTPNLPIHSVRTEDAMAYAHWHGKRLLTPTEWECARRGDRTRELLAAYFQARQETAVLIRQQQNLLRRTPGAMVQAHVRAAAGEMGEYIFTLVERLESRFGYPHLLAPAGSREADVSVFGVLDVGLNIDELLLPNLAQFPTESTGGDRKRLGVVDPDIFNDVLWRVWHYARWVGVPVTMVGADGLPIRHFSQAGRAREWTLRWGVVSHDQRYLLNTHSGTVSNGFRCAR